MKNAWFTVVVLFGLDEWLLVVTTIINYQNPPNLAPMPRPLPPFPVGPFGLLGPFFSGAAAPTTGSSSTGGGGVVVASTCSTGDSVGVVGILVGAGTGLLVGVTGGFVGEATGEGVGVTGALVGATGGRV